MYANTRRKRKNPPSMQDRLEGISEKLVTFQDLEARSLRKSHRTRRGAVSGFRGPPRGAGKALTTLNGPENGWADPSP